MALLVTSMPSAASGVHVTERVDQGSEPSLSDVLAAQRELVSRGGYVGLQLGKQPSVDDLRELHDEIVARREEGLTEEWEALSRAKKLRAASADGAAAEALMMQRVANANPTRLRSHGTAVQVSQRALDPSAAAMHGNYTPPPDAPSMRSIGTAPYNHEDARASRSGFRQALSRCYAVGGRLSAVSIPSSISSMDTRAKLDALRSQATSHSPEHEWKLLEPSSYHAARQLLRHEREAIVEDVRRSDAVGSAPSRGLGPRAASVGGVAGAGRGRRASGTAPHAGEETAAMRSEMRSASSGSLEARR